LVVAYLWRADYPICGVALAVALSLAGIGILAPAVL
jgi:hypothetical protein